MSSINTSNIKRSLITINDFIDGKETISTGKDFIQIYSSTHDLLLEYGKSMDTKFYENRISASPSFTEDEINEIIKDRTGENRVPELLAGLYGVLAKVFLGFIKNRSIKSPKTNQKLEELKRVNTSFISAIEKPGLEELIEESLRKEMV